MTALPGRPQTMAGLPTRPQTMAALPARTQTIQVRHRGPAPARVGHNDRMGAGTDPVYLRVLEDLRAQIRDGVLTPGARVPSRNGIMARYGVGETAAKHALQVLATEGLIEARAGSGSYVRRVPAAARLEHGRNHFPGPAGCLP